MSLADSSGLIFDDLGSLFPVPEISDLSDGVVDRETSEDSFAFGPVDFESRTTEEGFLDAAELDLDGSEATEDGSVNIRDCFDLWKPPRRFSWLPLRSIKKTVCTSPDFPGQEIRLFQRFFLLALHSFLLGWSFFFLETFHIHFEFYSFVVLHQTVFLHVFLFGTPQLCIYNSHVAKRCNLGCLIFG